MEPKPIYPSNPLLQHQLLQAEIEKAMVEVARSGSYILGAQVAELEKQAAEYLGVKHTLACASGTDALLLSMVALKVSAGDEIITSSFSFIAVVEVACYLKAVPVLVDINPKTFNINPQEVQKAISKKTKAIVPVHLYGQCAEMDALQTIASEHGLQLIEDAAQSFGARYKNKQSGSMSAAGCFSFYPTKNLSCYGDGGMIALSDNKILQDLRALRNHGSYKRYKYEKIGYNSRLDEIQAAILRIKLKHIDRWNEQRKQAAAQYDELFTGVLQTPFRQEFCEHVFHQYTILTPHREKLVKKLQAENIYAGVYYPYPLHLQPAIQKKCKSYACWHAERIAKECLSLPIYAGITPQEIARVAEVVLAHHR